MKGLSFGVRKGAWSREEDLLLKKCIETGGEGKWHQVPSKAGLNRCRKSCRMRWLSYLKPSIKRGEFEDDEVDIILRLHRLLGNRWSLIAGRLPGRTANDVKNYWNTHLLKKFNPSNKNFKQKAHNPHHQNPPNIDANNNNVTNTNVVIKPRPITLKKKSFIRFDHIGNNNDNNNNNLATRSNNWLAEGDSNQESNYYNCLPSNTDETLWWQNLLKMNIDDQVNEQLQEGAADNCFDYSNNNILSGMGDNAMVNGVDYADMLGERGISNCKVVDEGNEVSWDQLLL